MEIGGYFWRSGHRQRPPDTGGDRVLHHATTVNIKGESDRLKEKKKAGLLSRTREESTTEVA